MDYFLFLFFKVFLLSGTGTLDKIERIAKTAVPEVLRTGGTADGSGRESLESESFRTCNKSTYAVYFRAAFLALVESASEPPPAQRVRFEVVSDNTPVTPTQGTSMMRSGSSRSN